MIDRLLKRGKFIWRNTPFGKIRKSYDALKWGIIGTGYMSDTFSRALNDSYENIFYAVASRSLDKAKAFARKYGAQKAFGSIDNLLNCQELDVVYIATPIECHYNQVEKCLLAGKNVLCEKPLTFTPGEANELFRLANENNCFLMEGIWTLCLPTMQIAKKWIANGRIGEIRYVRADLNKRMDIEHIRKHYGVLFDYGIYGVAFIDSFMPRKAILSAVSSFRTEDNIITDISADFNAEECCGALNLSSNLNAQSKAVVIGTKGSIEWESPFNRTNTLNLFDIHGQCLERYSNRYAAEGFEYELNEVYKSIKSKKLESQIIPSNRTLTVLRIINELING